MPLLSFRTYMVLTRPPFLLFRASLSTSYRDLRLFLVYLFGLPSFPEGISRPVDQVGQPL